MDHDAARVIFEQWKRKHNIRGSFEAFVDHLAASFASEYYDLHGRYDWPKIFNRTAERTLEYMTYTDPDKKIKPMPAWEPKKSKKAKKSNFD